MTSRSLLLCSVTHLCAVFEVCVWIIVRLVDPNMAHYKISNRVSLLYSSIFHCTYGVLFIPVFTKPILSVCCKKANVFVSSDHRSPSHLKFQSCLITGYAGVCFWMS